MHCQPLHVGCVLFMTWHMGQQVADELEEEAAGCGEFLEALIYEHLAQVWCTSRSSVLAAN